MSSGTISGLKAKTGSLTMCKSISKDILYRGKSFNSNWIIPLSSDNIFCESPDIIAEYHNLFETLPTNDNISSIFHLFSTLIDTS